MSNEVVSPNATAAALAGRCHLASLADLGKGLARPGVVSDGLSSNHVSVVAFPLTGAESDPAIEDAVARLERQAAADGANEPVNAAVTHDAFGQGSDFSAGDDTGEVA